MKKIYTVGLAVVAVFAFSVIAAASASAASEWLLDGAAITGTPDPVEATGELLIEDVGTGTQIECSGKFDGTVGPGTLGKIEKILNLTSVEETSNENLAKITKSAIDCKFEAAGLCNVSVGALVWLFSLHLPWATELLLPSPELWVDDITTGAGGEPAYEVSCSTIIGTETDICEGKPGANMKNVTGGVEGVFEENETTNPKGNCSIGGNKSSLTTGKYIITVSSGTLTVS